MQAGFLFGEEHDKEVVLRHSTADVDLASKLAETTLGLNLFNAGYDSRWSFDVTDVENRDADNSDSKVYRVQYQQVF